MVYCPTQSVFQFFNPRRFAIGSHALQPPIHGEVDAMSRPNCLRRLKGRAFGINDRSIKVEYQRVNCHD